MFELAIILTALIASSFFKGTQPDKKEFYEMRKNKVFFGYFSLFLLIVFIVSFVACINTEDEITSLLVLSPGVISLYFFPGCLLTFLKCVFAQKTS